MIFHYNYPINISKITRITKLKKLEILDFGCGIGNWIPHDVNLKKIKKIILYDNNPNLKKLLKKKYSNKKFHIEFNYKNIIKKKFNVVIFSSVIQYIPAQRLKKIINDLEKNKKKLFIIFTDVPYLSRILEFSLLPFFNLKRFIYVLKIIFLSEYKKINFFIYKKNSFNIFKSKFNLIFSKNLHDLKFLRYSLIMRLK
jgi:2-polyprenyl-3-methyl-5-hydroxy-6-metoxy-1,4-benzoquinol methylase